MQFNHQFSPTNALRPNHIIQMTASQHPHKLPVQMQVHTSSNQGKGGMHHTTYNDISNEQFSHAASVDKSATPKGPN